MVLYKLSAKVGGGVIQPGWELGIWLGKQWGNRWACSGHAEWFGDSVCGL